MDLGNKYCNYRSRAVFVFGREGKIWCVGCPYFPYNSNGNCEHLK